jgi:conjugative transfer pilus assembly protein TraH
MKKPLRKIVSFVTIISLVGMLPGSGLFTGTAGANWVDDWVSATAGGGPMYFEGQKRGYYSGGGFSARWGSTVDPLLTITAPKMKGGCGGIDMFLGGFSFMDFNYLVDKLQKILASVPAVAFDLALNVLCEPCSKAIKSFEAISDSLNGLQIDDCKAARGVTAKIMSSFVDDPSKKADLEAIYADFKQSSGLSNLYKAVTEGTRAVGDQPNDLALTMALNGCPANLRQIFGTSGYVLDKLQSRYGFNGYADMLRGAVGDVRVEVSPDGRVKAAYVKPCDDNDLSNMRKFVTGEFRIKTVAEVCVPLPDANRDLVRYVSDRMTGIAASIRTKGAISAGDEAFINFTPVPMARILQMAVKSGQEASMIRSIAPFVATAYSYAMLTDFMGVVKGMMQYGQSVASSESDAGPMAPEYTCKVELLHDAQNGLREIYARAEQVEAGLKAEYLARANEYVVLQTAAKRFEEFDGLAYAQLSRLFGPSMARRAMSSR